MQSIELDDEDKKGDLLFSVCSFASGMHSHAPE